MANDILRAEIRAYRWLQSEHRYRCGNNEQTFNTDPQQKLDSIMGYEIKNKWGRYLLSRRNRPNVDDEQYFAYNLRASQMILKATSAAQDAVIWNGIIIGRGSEETIQSLADKAHDASWGVLRRYYDTLASDPSKVPDAALLDQPLSEAIAPYNLTPIERQYTPLPVYTSLAGLAVSHILEQYRDIGSMVLPQPGTPSGEVARWKPPAGQRSNNQ